MVWEEGNAMLDYHVQESEDGVAKGSTHVFHRGRNTTGEVMTLNVEWQWVDPSFPPLTQVFPKADHCHSFVSGLAP